MSSACFAPDVSIILCAVVVITVSACLHVILGVPVGSIESITDKFAALYYGAARGPICSRRFIASPWCTRDAVIVY